jgi:hypothetical protein
MARRRRRRRRKRRSASIHTESTGNRKRSERSRGDDYVLSTRRGRNFSLVPKCV